MFNNTLLLSIYVYGNLQLLSIACLIVSINRKRKTMNTKFNLLPNLSQSKAKLKIWLVWLAKFQSHQEISESMLGTSLIG